MKRENFKLYFIALVPDEPTYSEVRQFKTEIKDQFDSKAALRSPPHITLHMPFQWKEEKEEVLISSLNKLTSSHSSFKVRLDNFGAFPPRVVYVDVIASAPLSKLHLSIQKLARSDWHIYPKTSNSRPFRPHMTIAFRDLKKQVFFDAWKEFEQREYQSGFTASNLCLLKHNGKSWDVFNQSPLQ